MTNYFTPLLQNRFWGQEKPLIYIISSGLKKEEWKNGSLVVGQNEEKYAKGRELKKGWLRGITLDKGNEKICNQDTRLLPCKLIQILDLSSITVQFFNPDPKSVPATSAFIFWQDSGIHMIVCIIHANWYFVHPWPRPGYKSSGYR